MSEVTAQIWCRSFHRGFVTVLLCCYPTCLSLQHLCAQHGAVTCLHLLWGSIKNSPPVLSFTEVTHLYLKKTFPPLPFEAQHKPRYMNIRFTYTNVVYYRICLQVTQVAKTVSKSFYSIFLACVCHHNRLLTPKTSKSTLFSSTLLSQTRELSPVTLCTAVKQEQLAGQCSAVKSAEHQSLVLSLPGSQEWTGCRCRYNPVQWFWRKMFPPLLEAKFSIIATTEQLQCEWLQCKQLTITSSSKGWI